MDFTALEKALRATFDDYKLSRNEKDALSEVVADFKGDEDKIRFIRNRAFELARGHINGTEDKAAIDWLEDIVRLLDKERYAVRPGISKAFFSPGKSCLNAILEELATCRESLDICVFTITDNRIKDGIADAHGRGVKVRIISDDNKAYDLGSDVMELSQMGIQTRIDEGSDGHMHHKYAIFDKEILITGSYNWTRSAARDNYENLVVTDDTVLVASFSEEFERLWATLPTL